MRRLRGHNEDDDDDDEENKGTYEDDDVTMQPSAAMFVTQTDMHEIAFYHINNNPQ